MTDGKLLERFIASRDEAAFETLVIRHGPMVLGVCRQLLRDDHEADDAFQATFLLLVRNATSIRKHDSLGSWLYGVAFRLSLRRKTNARRRVLVGHDVEMPAFDPENEFDRRESLPLIHDEIDRLPEKYRSPIVLCYLEGRSHEEAAAQLRCPIGTVKGRLARAREMLKPRLSRRGLALTVGLTAMLQDEGAQAAVTDRLVMSTVRAAVDLALGLDAAATSGAFATSSSDNASSIVHSNFSRFRVPTANMLAVLAVIAGFGFAGFQFVGMIRQARATTYRVPPIARTANQTNGGGRSLDRNLAPTIGAAVLEPKTCQTLLLTDP